MKTKITLFMICIIILACSLMLLSVEGIASMCEAPNINMDCFKLEMGDMYANEYNKFWDFLYSFEKNASTCKDISYTSSFLDMLYVKTRPAELSEYVNEVTWSLFFFKTECYFDALLLMDKERRIESLIVLHGISSYYEAKVDKILSYYRNHKKYSPIVKQYYMVGQR